MRKRVWGMSMVGVLVLLVISSSAFVAQRPRNRPDAPPPAANDLKIKYRMTMAGQTMETTTMLKGARERSEMKMGYGTDIFSITQCDLKRTLQVSDKTRKYVVTPMETADSTANSGADARVTPEASEPLRRGGVVTYNTTSVDTGERKDMFGFKARHVKTTVSIESSGDACSPVKQRMETDGWYIDFTFGLNCETGGSPMMGRPHAAGGCRDRVRFNRQGAARTGYALMETMTMYGPNGAVTFTSTREVIELSREPLDAALFDVPAGYVEAKDSQELYGMPSMETTMSPATQGRQPVEDNQSNQSNAGNRKAPGVIRVGVVRINNKTDRGVSVESLRERLISGIQGSGIEAVGLIATSPGEAEAEAKARQCDFILYTDIAALKTSTAKKIGGMFGRAAGVAGIDKTEAKVEYRLFAVSETAARLQSAAAAKEEGDEASAGTAVEQEARVVSAEVRKNNRN
ncbi:MAG: hypothetical protein M3R52_00790 [Acidobacteriota bacterium]|nr:hypothetical protein [Acidobacteriota bacterium]